jgi:parallel beta-helix repeat protein
MKKIVLFIAILVAFTLCFSTVKAATKAQIDTSIAHGLAWLAGQQNTDGSWGSENQIAQTGLAVKKFEHHAVAQGKSPLDPTYQYYPQVKRGLNYLFSMAEIMPISPQPAGNPDTDGDSIGVGWDGGESYHTGIALMAIAESNCPDSVVNVPGIPVNGWTYRHVASEAVDFLAFAQNDTGDGRGGWGYWANYGSSDNSNSGYATLGLAFAQAIPPLGFSIPVPAFVKTELSIWIDYIQCDQPGPGTDDGGSGYSDNYPPNNGPCGWVNTLKTGNLLFQMALTGQYAGTNRDRAVAYLVRHWNDHNTDPGWQIHYQAMFCIMKGLEFQGISIMSGIDWYKDFADSIVFYQHPDGSWGPDLYGNSMILATAWALLTLERAAPPPEFNIPDQCVPAGGKFAKFDADTFVTTGTPPFTWTWSGNVNLTVTKDANNVFTITYPSGWTGSETITFHATDQLGMTWDDNATFTVDPVPVVGNIPDQWAPFVPINLDSYLSGISPSLVTWSASGMSCLVVNINPITHVATVTNPGGCTLPEVIRFTATATACGKGVSASDTATFHPKHGQIRCVNCPGECYSSIQAAVNDAEDGDTIHVCCRDGMVYHENVVINGFHNLAIAADGGMIDLGCECAAGCTLMSSTPRTGYGFHITNSSNVRISGFTIVGYQVGIFAENSAGLNIHDNDIELNLVGIAFGGTNGSMITHNCIHANIFYDPWEGMGIGLVGSDRNQIIGNVIGWNGGDGIRLAEGSDYNFISHNTIHDNVKYGARVIGNSANNEIWSNCFYRNRASISSQGLDDGWDTGMFMYWDNGKSGNYWSDWDYAGGGPYPIDGLANTSDRYPTSTLVKVEPESLKIPPSHQGRICLTYYPSTDCCPHQELYGYSLKLVFDSRYLDVVSVSPGPFPTIPPNMFPIMTWKVKHTETWDTLYIDQTCLGDTFATAKNPICLADVVFHGKTCSEAWLPVRIVKIDLRDHPYKEHIAVHTEDGFIKVLPECLKGFWASRGKDGVLLWWMDSPCHSHWGVHIVKAPYHDYPWYRDIYEPDYPDSPYDSFFVFQGQGNSFFYSTRQRDIFYFSAFAVDDSGNYSECYQTARATSYILGDFDSNGVVNERDLWRLGRCYWTCIGDRKFDPYCDIGPTDTAGCIPFISPASCPPNPDSCINFEDLLIFAENFGIDPKWGKPAPIEIPSEVDISAPIASGEKGNEVEVKLMVDNANGVKGMRIALDFDRTQLQLLSITPGKLVSDSRIFFWSASDEIEISCAALGQEYTIGGSGEVASIKFKVLREGPVNLTSRVLDLRDVDNYPISCTFNKGAVGPTAGKPDKFALLQNYPNPFNPETYISFALPVASPVSLKIYNVAGQLVKSLADGEQMSAGLHMVRWDGTNQTGEKVASGIYFYKMNAGDFQATKKMVVTK